uniref:Uncharacterized protein LOC114348572 n=1 Tax=Diabrotica virgifera virgifera TaxID=50390 RepID=A0A6P7HB68_DIAVI
MEHNKDLKDSGNQEMLTPIKDEEDSLNKYNNIEVKSELDESSYGPEYVLDESCSHDFKIENHMLEDVSNEIKVEIKSELEECSIGKNLVSLHFKVFYFMNVIFH